MTTRSPSLLESYQQIQGKILAAAGDPTRFKNITLIAVSKTQSAEKIRALYQLGQRDFGENYAQELVQKAEQLKDCSEIRWHFIGHLQSNKAKTVVPLCFSIHSIDSEKLAKEIAKACRSSGRKLPLPVFIEVNIDQEDSKAGLEPGQLKNLASAIQKLPELSLQGLMCIPSAEGDASQSFAMLRSLEKELHPASKGALSMGMSSDFEAAISEGATHIRVGTALFGSRT